MQYSKHTLRIGGQAQMLLLMGIAVSIVVILIAGFNRERPEPPKMATGFPVRVIPRPMPGSPIRYDSTKRYIFLTFDDAPQPPGTINCRNAFAAEEVKATFFLVGLHARSDHYRQAITDSLRNSYPEFLVANHSYTHAFRNHYAKYYAHPDSAVRDLLKGQESMNIPCKIIRLPGCSAWVGRGENTGSPATKAVRNRLDSLGYNVIGWDVEWDFRKGSIPKQSAAEMAKEVTYGLDHQRTHMPNAIVILAHDRMFAQPRYADSLTRFIALLKEDPRNVFETIDHYPLVQR